MKWIPKYWVMKIRNTIWTLQSVCWTLQSVCKHRVFSRVRKGCKSPFSDVRGARVNIANRYSLLRESIISWMKLLLCDYGFTVTLWECYHCCNEIVLNALWIDGQLQAYLPILLNSSHVIVRLNPCFESNCRKISRRMVRSVSVMVAESEYNRHLKNPSCQWPACPLIWTLEDYVPSLYSWNMTDMMLNKIKI